MPSPECAGEWAECRGDDEKRGAVERRSDAVQALSQADRDAWSKLVEAVLVLATQSRPLPRPHERGAVLDAPRGHTGAREGKEKAGRTVGGLLEVVEILGGQLRLRLALLRGEHEVSGVMRLWQRGATTGGDTAWRGWSERAHHGC